MPLNEETKPSLSLLSGLLCPRVVIRVRALYISHIDPYLPTPPQDMTQGQFLSGV